MRNGLRAIAGMNAAWDMVPFDIRHLTWGVHPIVRLLQFFRVTNMRGVRTTHSESINSNCAISAVRGMAIVLCLVVSILPGAMFGAGSPAFVQEKDNRVSSGKTVTVTASSHTTSGNLIAVYVVWDNTSTISLSDSAGNSYASAAGPIKWNSSKYGSQTFYAKNVKGGADTVTATFTTAIKSFGEIYMIEYSGLDQTAPFDASAAAIGSSGSLNSGSVTITSVSNLLFAAGVSVNNVTSPGPGYIARATSNGDMIMDKNVSMQGTYNATASNSGGAWAMQMVAFQAAIGTPDTTPPTVPAGFSATTVSVSQINLTWTPSTDNIGVAGYRVYRNGAQVATTTSTTYPDTGLASGTTYTYNVAAFDAAGNVSALSTAASAATLSPALPQISFFGANPASIIAGQVTTLSWVVSNSTSLTVNQRVGNVTSGGSVVVSPTTTTVYTLTAANGAGSTNAQTTVTVSPDTTPPTVPAGFSATTVSVSQINLTWTPSTDNIGVAGYRVYRNGAQVATTTSTTYPDTGLASGTTYTYNVAAFDAAGNVSALSTAASAATLSPALPQISFFGANPASIIAGQVTTLSWVVSNSTSLTVNQGVGNVTSGGSVVVSPTTTTVYTLTAANGAGSTNAQTTVTVSPDTTPPTVPAGFSATTVSVSQINLTWTPSTDNIGVAGYRVYRNGAQVATTTSTTYPDTGLASGQPTHTTWPPLMRREMFPPCPLRQARRRLPPRLEITLQLFP